jgi:parallel beta-helix repeat protein
MNGDASLGGDGVISGALVSQNRIYNNGTGGGSGINMDGVVDSRIENNLLYDNHASGISLYQIDGGAPSTGNLVINNTIHQASDGRWALNIQDGSTDNVARNNILVSEHSFRGAIDISADSRGGFVSDYNVVVDRFTSDDFSTNLTLAGWQTQTGNDFNSHVANADALFTDWQAGDYRLLADSVARDTGSALDAPALDLLGALRPAGTAHDIGALEFSDAAVDIDGDTDGDIDGHDFLILQRSDPTLIAHWKTQYGSGLALQTWQSVPEPSPLLLAVFWAALPCCAKRSVVRWNDCQDCTAQRTVARKGGSPWRRRNAVANGESAGIAVG